MIKLRPAWKEIERIARNTLTRKVIFLNPPPNIFERAVWLGMRLTDRDLADLETVYRLGLATGSQIERLHFFGLSSSFSVRKRVLHRLVESRALIVLPRRVGGSFGGAGAAIYGIDPAGAVLIQTIRGVPAPDKKTTASNVSPRLHSHVLAVSEIYVQLIESSRKLPFAVADFQTEPESWWTTELGDVIKPDAYAALVRRNHRVTDHWWIEVDRGTESVSIVEQKMRSYLRIAQSEITGPGGVIPRVLFSAPDNRRTGVLTRIARKFPAPADRLFVICSQGLATLDGLTRDLFRDDQ
ncbi:hypothetical protein BTM25_47950 [Actinomadura rubteroloni]|uniref:Replication-relaxation n=1 Tax=Actinomadura rubteroloni TaxID=1926885 RepID=A0A2P4UF28_9ACTN|nr:replication-relaxation family protein [Actinomadura rubteroloni]POM23636.1 hypothetical protein BTM25_47950 [Actinomadura rubteroloni]